METKRAACWSFSWAWNVRSSSPEPSTSHWAAQKVNTLKLAKLKIKMASVNGHSCYSHCFVKSISELFWNLFKACPTLCQNILFSNQQYCIRWESVCVEYMFDLLITFAPCLLTKHWCINTTSDPDDNITVFLTFFSTFLSFFSFLVHELNPGSHKWEQRPTVFWSCWKSVKFTLIWLSTVTSNSIQGNIVCCV